MKTTSIRALVGAMLTLSAATALAGPEERIREALSAIDSNIQIGAIQPSPVDGLYEVMVGAELMYVTGDGRHYVAGPIVDLKTREDLTEPRLAAVRKALIDELGEEQMVVFGPEKPKHSITVFTDIECGYCRKLHSQIEDYAREGIEVRYLFFPRAGEGSAAYEEAVSVWCAGDAEARRTAMTQAKAGEPIDTKTCDNPIAAHMALGRELGLRGTPAIVTEDGSMIPGYVDPRRLAARLEAGAGS
ncbi:MAG: DsbC family protein [Chromatiaceae bacterium]|nr:DsbC family protein [Chromatiaceae bacterium]